MARRRREASEDPERASLDAVLAAIHRVNPTARAVSPAEAERRYAEKARWQSALVRRFGDWLAVQAEADPAVVGLRLLTGRPAGHARIDGLDDSARAWVRARLVAQAQGLGEPGAAAAPPTPPWAELSADGLDTDAGEAALAAGLAALADFDYPAAEVALSQALPRLRAAQALLDLYVDCLADDAAALALWHRLDGAARSDAAVRAAVAVAGSRLGDRAVTERALGAATGPRAAKAWVRLGYGALAAGELGQASDDLAAARRADLNLAAAGRLAEALAAARAAACAPREAALAAEVAAAWAEAAAVQGEGAASPSRDGAAAAPGVFDGIEARARTLLAEHPASAVARQALEAVAGWRRGQARAASLARAEAAEAAGALGAAAAHLRAALTLAVPRPAVSRPEGGREAGRDAKGDAGAGSGLGSGLGSGGEAGDGALWARLARLEAAALDRSRGARCAAVRTLLAEASAEEGLLAWLALPAEDRAAVAAPAPLAAWLTELVEGPAATRAAPKAAVRAVLALAAAQAAVEAGEAGAARAALLPHQRALGALPAAAAVWARVAALETAAREAEVALRLADAEAACASGRPERALARLADLPREGLSRAVAARAEALLAEARKAHTVLALVAEAEARVAADDLLAARALLDRLLALEPGGRRWRAWRAALDVAIAKVWQHTVLHPHAADTLPDAWAAPAVEPWGRWITPDGSHAVVASTFGAWLVLRWLTVGDPEQAGALEAGQVAEHVSEHMPEHTREHMAEQVADAGARSGPPQVSRAVVLRLPRAVTWQSWAVGPEGVRWVDGGGGLLGLTPGGSSIAHWQVPLAGLGTDHLEEVGWLPGGGAVWFSLPRGEGLVSVVVDAERAEGPALGAGEVGRAEEAPGEARGESRRTIERPATAVVVLSGCAPGASGTPESAAGGIAEARVARLRGAQVDLHAPNGRLEGTLQFERPVRALTGAPGRVVALCADDDAERFWLVLRRPGQADVSVDFEGDLRWPHGLLLAADGVTVYLHHHDAGGQVLRALRLEAPVVSRAQAAPVGPGAQTAAWRAGWQVAVPARVGLLAATGGAFPCVFTVDERGPQLERLRFAAPPHLRVLPERTTGLAPTPWTLMPCGGLSLARAGRVRALVKLLRAQPAPRRRPWIEAQVTVAMPVDEVVELFHAVLKVAPTLAAWVAEQARARFPESAQVRLLHADRAARTGQWGRVGVLLGEVQPGFSEADHAAHFHHLAGLSLLQSGAEQGARTAWRSGLACDARDPCGLAALLRALDADDDDALSEYALRMRLIARADAARAAGDFAGVVALLDTQAVWRHPEAQSFARLTEAALETPARDDESWLRKLRAVAAFLWLTDPARPVPPGWADLTLPAARWDAQRVADLRERARWWLSPGPGSS